MQFINVNIPDTILGKDGKTLYKLVHVSGSCYNVVEIVYPVPEAHPVPFQQMPSTPVHSGKKIWHNKGPRSHNGNQNRGSQPLNQVSAPGASKKENEVIVLKPKQQANGKQNRGPQPLNQPSIQNAGKKENEVIVLKPAQQQQKSGAPKKRYYNKGQKKAPAASAAPQETVVPPEQVPEKVVEEKVAEETVAVPSDC